MPKKNSAPIAIGVGALAAAGVAAFAFSSSKPKDPEIPKDPTKPKDPEIPKDPTKPKDPEIPKDPTKPKDPEIPKDPTKPKDPSGKSGHAVIGSPFTPGRVNERKNAVIAVSRRPESHPIGAQKGAANLDTWLANVAYWESYPDGPARINPADAKHASAWLRIRGFVRALLSKSTDPAKPQKPTKPAGDVFVSAVNFPDLGIEANNSLRAVQLSPTTWTKNAAPHHRWNEKHQSFTDWLTNVAYWATYPKAPVVLSKTDKPFVAAWMRINKIVVGLWKKSGKSEPKNGRPETTTKPIEPAGGQPSEGSSTSKSDLASAAEKKNVAIFVVEHPGKKEGDAVNEIYWLTYPDGPKALDPKDETHKAHIAAWLRIRDGYRQAKALTKKLPGAFPDASISDENWRQWAIAMALSSDLRSPSSLADALKKSLSYFRSDSGKKVLERDIGRSLGTFTISRSAILAEAAQRVPTGKLTEVTHWSAKPSRAFFVTNGLF